MHSQAYTIPNQTGRRGDSIVKFCRCGVATSQISKNWDVYINALAYAYSSAVHRSTGYTSFELILSKPPGEFSIQGKSQRVQDSMQDQREEFVRRMEAKLPSAAAKLAAAQARYRREFDRRTCETNQENRPGGFMFIDSEDGTGNDKLGGEAIGPFEVLGRDQRTFVIHSDTVVERDNSDRETRAPRTHQTQKGVSEKNIARLDATSQDMARNETERKQWLVEDIYAHRMHPDGVVKIPCSI